MDSRPRTTICKNWRLQATSLQRTHFLKRLPVTVLLVVFSLMGFYAEAQVNVLTAHNDIARTGQNVKETILTPSNVNPSQFGKLFSQTVSGGVLAQPLYVSQVAIPGKGSAPHNVVYVSDADRRGVRFRCRHQRRDQRDSSLANIAADEYDLGGNFV